MGSNSQDIHHHLGCGTELNQPPITLNINTTTGGTFSVTVDHHNSVENLKKMVAKKLKVAKDRICLLHREKVLHDGTSLKDNGIMDGSRIILLPNVETGLLAQRPENTVMQALESLNDSQVNDFLSGKTPLNLSMRLGDHMMLIQLQLSTVNPSASTSSQTSSGPRTRGLIRSRTSSSKQSMIATASGSEASTSKASGSSAYITPENTPRKYATATPSTVEPSTSGHQHTMNVPPPSMTLPSQQHQIPIRTVNQAVLQDEGERDLILSNEEFENLRSIVSSLTSMRNAGIEDDVNEIELEATYDSTDILLEQSPIKSLSNLVSSPIKTIPLKKISSVAGAIAGTSTNAIKQHISEACDTNRATAENATCPDPITAKFTSCLCKRLDTNSNSNGCDTNCQLMRQQHHSRTSNTNPLTNRLSRPHSFVPGPSTSSTNFASSEARSTRSSSLLHRTLNNPIARMKASQGHPHSHRHGSYTANLRRSKSSDNIHLTEPTSSRSPPSQAGSSIYAAADNAIDITDTMLSGPSGIRTTGTLAEASRNLTKTLRKLSKEVFTNKVDVATITGDENPRSRSGTGGQLTSSGAKAGGSTGGSAGGIGSGAVIESMRSHGKGIYSGTFSGTLNPALQDRYGRPKRDISTVIHILNDLLSATPHYSRGARISFEPTGSSRSFKHGSSRRSFNGTSSHRDHCSRCVSAPKTSSALYGECNGHSIESTKTAISFCRRHSGGHDIASSSKINSMPSTPTNHPVITCHQCQSRLTHSAPVTPIATPTTSIISFNELLFGADNNRSISSDDTVTLNPICTKCSNMELENSKTKSKLDQLRLVMQQRKERREARKLKASPYGARIIGSTCPAPTSGTVDSNNPGIQSTIDAAGPPTNIIIEHVDAFA